MKKKLLRTISFCLLAAALLSIAAFAFTEANKYIASTVVSIGANNGVVTVVATVTATDIYPDVGIDALDIYQVGKATPVATYTYTSRPSLMGHNTGSHTATVTYNGSPNERYYAEVGFYAGQMRVAGGGHTMTSKVAP